MIKQRIPETKDISEYEQKMYAKLSFKTVWDNWYIELQGNYELLSDRFLLCWLKANAPESYEYKKGLLEQWYRGDITDGENYTKALEQHLIQKGLLQREKTTRRQQGGRRDGCKPCVIPGRPARCNEKNGLLNDRGGQ